MLVGGRGASGRDELDGVNFQVSSSGMQVGAWCLES